MGGEEPGGYCFIHKQGRTEAVPVLCVMLSQLRPLYLIVAVEHYYRVFKELLENAATVNTGTISPLIPALCVVHGSPGFCPKAPVLHLTLSCTWLASARRG